MVVKYKGQKYYLSDDERGVLRPAEIVEYHELIHYCLNSIHESETTRNIVLETWMLIEYHIRLALSEAFNLLQYDNDSLDSKYELLPSNFQTCLNILRKLLKNQRTLPIRPRGRSIIDMDQGLYKYFSENYPDIFNEVKKIETEYNKTLFPKHILGDNYIGQPQYFLFQTYHDCYQNVSLVSHFSYMDDTWFDKAIRINNARNVAAHVFNPDKIYERLGINGSDKFALCKNYCLDLILDMCGIKKCDDDVPIDFDFD